MHADSVRHLEIKIRGINKKLTRIEGERGKTLPFLFDRKKRCAYNKGVILKNRRRTERTELWNV